MRPAASTFSATCNAIFRCQTSCKHGVLHEEVFLATCNGTQLRCKLQGKLSIVTWPLVVIDSLSKANVGYKHILTAIDVLSEYAWVQPLKTTSKWNLVKAFEKICKKGRQPEKLHTDKGNEFTDRLFQNFLKNKNILFFTTHNETNASIVESFNRTLKGKMWKYLTANNSLKYTNVLQKLSQ